MRRSFVRPAAVSVRRYRAGLVRCRGFTLTELIVTMVVAGTLAAVAVPRFTGDTGFEDRGLRDQTAAALRYAQKSAIAARRTVCLTFTATGLTARIATNSGATDCTTGVALAGPSATSLTVAATGSATYSAHPGTALTFGPLGRPGPASNTTISVTNLPAALNLTVEAETGYVH